MVTVTKGSLDAHVYSWSRLCTRLELFCSALAQQRIKQAKSQLHPQLVPSESPPHQGAKESRQPSTLENVNRCVCVCVCVCACSASGVLLFFLLRNLCSVPQTPAKHVLFYHLCLHQQVMACSISTPASDVMF